MKKKFLAVAAAAAMSAALVVAAGCANNGGGGAAPASSAPVEGSASVETSIAIDTSALETSILANMTEDEAAALLVDELIAGIQVQEWTDDTPELCAAAKAAWDALTPEQQALVGEYDYFGRDTGNAAADDPLNTAPDKENEILVVSFGTSFNDSRAATIGAIEKAIQAANPDWAVRRAFTAQIIINHVLARDGVQIDNVQQALDKALAAGVKNLVVQPTHLMHGAEYDELMAILALYDGQFESISVAEPLLGQVGADATVINDDKRAVGEAAATAAAQAAGYDNVAAAKEDGTALVLMGHGTSHEANVTYDQMQTVMSELGYDNVFIGTVEGEPEDTECSAVIDKVKQAGYKKVYLRPLMVVAGDHANNDMADPDDPESWLSQFSAAGFDSVMCQIAGLGQIPAVQDLYVAHTAAALPAK